MIRHRAGIGAAALLAAAALAGCGGGTPGGAGTPAASVPGTTGSYTPLTKDTFSSAVTKATKAQKSAHMTLRLGSLLDARADVDLSSAEPNAELRTRISAGTSQMTMTARVVDGVSYVSITGMTPPGKFVRIDKDANQIEGLHAFGAADPSSVTSAFSEGVTALEYVGPATIGGATTHHYRVTVDTAGAVKALGADAVTGSATKDVPKTITEQVYLNADNTLRRGVIALSGQTGRVDFTRWGEPVTVRAPAKSQIVTAPKN